MIKLFTSVLNMSITASYIALAVIILRLLLKKTPKVYSYMLWLPVLIRLVCPFSFSSAISLLNFLKPDINSVTGTIEYVPYNIGLMQKPEINTGISSANHIVNSSLPYGSPAASINKMQIIMGIACIIWTVGMCALSIYSIISYFKVKKNMKTATLLKDNIFETDRISTPFLCGFIKPKIYIPAGISENELSYVITHEQIHIKRLDHIIKPFAFLVLAVHWFNPLIWLSFTLMSKDMEMSCDESVIKKMGDDSMHGYSSSLLSLSIKRSGLKPLNPLAFGESNVRSRIKNVLCYKKPALLVMAVLSIAVLIMIAVFTTNPKQQETTLDTYLGYPTKLLIDNKISYIGRTAVTVPINAMPLPKGIFKGPIESKVASSHHEITITYTMKDSSALLKDGAISGEALYPNAIVLFSLIEDVDAINFKILDKTGKYDGASYTFPFTRDNADTAVGKDVKEFAKSEDSLKELIQNVQKLTFGPDIFKSNDNKGLSLPYTISKNIIKFNDDYSLTVIIEMTEGKYFKSADVPPGGGIYNENYQGKYQIRVLNNQGSAVFTYSDLAKDFDDDNLNFAGTFNLTFDDYNNDGNPDFTLGQWGGSNGSFYNIYTIEKGGKITKLDAGGMLYISSHDPSIQLEKADKARFSIKYYDQKSGMENTKVYNWSNGKFRSSNKL